LGCETHVLAILADRQRKLILVDDCLNRARGGVTEYPRDLGGCQCETRKAFRIARPRDDVDALAAQLVHDGLHARALHTDTRADRIDRLVAREDGDLGAASNFAGDRADLDRAGLNLRHFELEERLNEETIRAAEHEAGSLGCLLDLLENCADRLALMIVLAMIL